MVACFTTYEVAELANASVRLVNKAIEEKILSRIPSGSINAQTKMLPLHAIPYVAIMAKLALTLSRETKSTLAKNLSNLPVNRMTSQPLNIEPSVTIDVPTLIGSNLAERAENYARAKQTYIDVNPDIMGGAPVIRGTRMTVYSVQGRLDNGDRIEDILEENPHITRDAVETAAFYARTHPMRGRPNSRPWVKTA